MKKSIEPQRKTTLGREVISLHYHELTPCVVSKSKWDTKEDTGKPMKHALYILWYAKRQAEATSSSENFSPCSLSGCRVIFA